MQEFAEDLESAMAAMRFRVLPGRWALIEFAGPATPEDLAALVPCGQVVVEPEGTSLLLAEAGLAGALARHPEARLERGLVWIRFEAPMAWEVVGFLARVAGGLAEAGVPIGAVCSYARDHLFVPERSLEAARAALGRLFPEDTSDSSPD